MHPAEMLICRIFEQAVEDYRMLKEEGVHKKGSYNVGFCSIDDIESFFNSDWCMRLLKMIDCNLKGIDILSNIQAQYT